MKSYDFVFVYEGKNRELENICLIRCELERRGYSVAFVETWDHVFYRSRPPRAHVAIGFALYNDSTVKYITSLVSCCNKIVNLQWEQVFTNGDASSNKEDLSSGVYGLAREAVHISWGKRNYRTLRNQYEVSDNHVCVTGHVTLDFLRPELKGYYLSREELLQQYHIPADKKICLFISSLSYAGLPQKVVNSPLYQNQGFDAAEFVEISEKTQKTLVEWFERILSQRDDCVFIYRPHPAEKESKLLADAAARFPNFRVISDLSVKQWILACDNIYTWWSTSIAEVYAAGKGCGILRPVPLPYNVELESYNNAQFITDYQAFADSVDSQLAFPIPAEILEEFYQVDPKTPAYMKVCNLLERVYRDDAYCMPISKVEHPYSPLKAVAFNVRSRVYQRFITKPWLKKMLQWKHPDQDMDAFVDNYQYNMQMQKNNHSSKREIDDIMRRIRKVLAVFEEGQSSCSHRETGE